VFVPMLPAQGAARTVPARRTWQVLVLRVLRRAGLAAALWGLLASGAQCLAAGEAASNAVTQPAAAAGPASIENSITEGVQAPPRAALYRRPRVEAPLCEVPPRIDGDISDPAWKTALHVTDFYNVREQLPPEEATEAWLCVDASALYVAFFAHDSMPEGIRLQETRRGGAVEKDDTVEINLDPENRGEHLYKFLVNPRGTQKEVIPGGSDTKIEWRGDWQGAARLVDGGWTAEMRIPFAILRYPQGQTTWGLNLVRRHIRTAHFWDWPPQPVKWDVFGIAQLCNLKLPRLRSEPIFMPSLQTEFAHGGVRTHVSLDAKYVTPGGNTAMLSISPDFRDIANEVESIDFSYTERWYADTRPFFVEGSGYWSRREIFYSRRIPEFDVGFKTFGSWNHTNFGILNTRTFGERNDLALEINQQIAQRQEAVFDYVRTDQPGAENDAIHLHGHYEKQLGAGLLHTAARMFRTTTRGAESGSYWQLQARRVLGPNRPQVNILWERIDPTFDPWLGYTPERDREGFEGTAEMWYRYVGRHREQSGGWVTVGRWDHLDGSRFHDDLVIGYRTDYGDGTHYRLRYVESDRPPNHDLFWVVGLGWNGKSLYEDGGAEVDWGRRNGADYLYYSLSQGWALGGNFRLRLVHEYRRSDYDDPTVEDTRVRRTSVYFNKDIDAERSVGGRLLTGTQGTNLYLTYRRAVSNGADVFVILGDPNAPTTEQRVAVKVKWTYR
jgi:hypothetical protein